ncbi:response regulator [Roseovarius sp. SCSIO 43702]|uniref:PAS domain-containing sensor histidine kinase n=1 Tax=Roseovarius sp. SCSIO 43702 TaxID=2823043 RepID=UPI001C732DA7|nr:PAS domain-containing sensor histidine kinase [Roseovarius sp. SCSIO 43702]QYX58573.1 response regulator [Roseovarius sp. SCSIO 43702]
MTQARLALGLVSLALGGVALWLGLGMIAARRRGLRTRALIAETTEHDPTPCVLTDAEGAILHRNTAARRDFPVSGADTLAGLLQSRLASPGTLLMRLETRAARAGAAVEDVVTREGHIRLGVHRAGEDAYLWRIERAGDMVPRRADPVPLPMITVGRNNAVLFMNQAARDLVGERARTLDRICPDLPLRSGAVNDVSTRDGLQPCLVVELEGTAGRREIFLLPGVAAPERQPDGWAFFDELPVPLLKLSADGTVTLTNRPARDLLGCEECVDQPLSEMLEGLGRPLVDWIADAAAGRGTVHSEFLRVKRKEGETFAQVTLNRAREGGETVLIAVMHDATELKSLEAQFVQSQKMQAIGQLAGGVAHDFNNLLTAITGHCDLLLLRHDQMDADYNDLVQINQNANRAAALVSQLLAYSRKQTLRPEIMDLRDALADLTHLLDRLVGEKVEMSLSHDPALWSIRADRRQLEQVLMNLVVNARDAMPGGGAVRIVTENLELEAPLVRDRATVAPGRYVKVSVEDDGTGIAPDKLRKVFEPFFTTKRVGEGTGLGLSTAYGIVKQTGGFIFADSEEGRGTTFFLLFPAFDRPVPAEAAPATPEASTGSAEGVVLLVEDEAPVRAFASRALQLRGFTVVEADSAEDALDILADETLRIDVFVTDVVMPGLDGPTWVQEALRTRPDVRTVFMSGYAEDDFADAQARIAHSVFLSKPFSLTDLTDTVQRQLAGAGGG